MLDEKHPFITLYCSHDGHPLNIRLGCGERTCPECRKKWFGRHLNPTLESVKTWGSVYFMTLTLQNFDGLIYRTDVTKLRKDFNRLRAKYKSKMKGGFYVVQATNRGKGWHLHLHILFDGSFIAKESLSRAWANITSGSYIVDIKAVKDPKIAIKYLLSDFLQAPRIRPEDRQEYNGIFKGLRIIQPFGIYKNIKFRKLYACPICGGTCWTFLDTLLGVKRSFKRVYQDEIDSS